MDRHPFDPLSFPSLDFYCTTRNRISQILFMTLLSRALLAISTLIIWQDYSLVRPRERSKTINTGAEKEISKSIVLCLSLTNCRSWAATNGWLYGLAYLWTACCPLLCWADQLYDLIAGNTPVNIFIAAQRGSGWPMDNPCTGRRINTDKRCCWPRS